MSVKKFLISSSKFFGIFAFGLIPVFFAIVTSAQEPVAPCVTRVLLQAQETLPTAQRLQRDQIEEMLQWELLHNYKLFREPNEYTPIQVVLAPKDEVEIIAAADVDPKLLEWVNVKTDHGEYVTWPKHPNNTSGKVPYASHKPQLEWLDSKKTSSRSIAVYPSQGVHPFTFKSGTNFPHKAQKQKDKIDTLNDVLGAKLRDPYIARRNAEIGHDPSIEVLRETLVLVQKKTGRGVIFRDYSPLKPGHHYFPGLSIPYDGRRIAEELNHSNFDEFWERHYSEAIGRAKAKLLLNYGLEMVTPNSQNILVELDSKWKPTGRIIFRDISDSKYVTQVATGIGEGAALRESQLAGSSPRDTLNPFSENSHWRFNVPGLKKSVPKKLVLRWQASSDHAYMNELKTSLGIPEKYSGSIQKIERWIKTPEGQQALREYDEALKKRQTNLLH